MNNNGRDRDSPFDFSYSMAYVYTVQTPSGLPWKIKLMRITVASKSFEEDMMNYTYSRYNVPADAQN